MKDNVSKLIQLINDKLVTSKQVSDESGVTTTTISRIKSGEYQLGNVKYDTIEALSNYYQEWYTMNKIQYKVDAEIIDTEIEVATASQETYEVDKAVFDRFLDEEDINMKDLTHDYMDDAYGYIKVSVDMHDEFVDYCENEGAEEPILLDSKNEGTAVAGTDWNGNYHDGF